jgi:large subunit ribosomal protein L13
MLKTYSAKPDDITKDWYVVDAEGQTLGRLATRISNVLRGKHKAIYSPNIDTGDNVIVINAEKITVSGKKFTDKLYRHHTGYIGHLKTFTFEQMMARKPERILEIAVKGMLPHNRLGCQQIKKLHVVVGPTHEHQAQQPKALPDHL